MIIDVLYNVEIQTGSKQSEPLDSPVYVRIYGTTTMTSKLFLDPNENSFTKDTVAKFDIWSNDVGEVQDIQNKNITLRISFYSLC